MKILVLTCSTGGGHNACARYIVDECKDNNIECDYKDYMDIVGSKASQIAEKIYLDSTRNNGLIFKGVYKIGELYSKTNIPSPVYGLNSLIKEKLYNYIVDNNYDLVIGTHLFPCVALTAIKKDHYIKFINVATDYECIPFWEETNPDAFVIPSELLKDRFIKKGIKEEILLPIGIPVASHFKDVKVTTEKMLLLTSGSMGFGKVKEIVDRILQEVKDYKLVVICGNNKNLEEELLKIDNPNLEVKGFVNNINEYIAKSEIVITKPGGLTTTEVATIRKPLIHMMPIPGVENYNANFFATNKMSLQALTIDEIITDIKTLISDKALEEELVNNQKKIINASSAADLIKYIQEHF